MRTGTILILSSLFLLVLSANASAQGPIGVSPGVEGSLSLIGEPCPTFSWGALPWAVGYELAVFEAADSDIAAYEEMAATAVETLRVDIPAPALSWTPGVGQCLGTGQWYIWYVRAVDEIGEGPWSQGRFFGVDVALSMADRRQVIQQKVEETLLQAEMAAVVARMVDVGIQRALADGTLAPGPNAPGGRLSAADGLAPRQDAVMSETSDAGSSLVALEAQSGVASGTLVLGPDGNAGIGTKGAARLHVHSPEATADDLFKLSSGSLLTQAPWLVVDGGGQVGIGTASPAAKLHLSGGALSVDNPGEGNVLLYLGTERHWQLRQLGADSSAALELASVGGGGNKNFAVNTGGSVGIGTTAPEAKLDVAGDLRVTGAFRGNLGPNGGAPFPRPAYDSGWVHTPRGEATFFHHGLGGNTDNYVVDVWFMDTSEGGEGVHLDGFGGDLVNQSGLGRGAKVGALNNQDIQVLRYADDVQVTRARVRIWIYP